MILNLKKRVEILTNENTQLRNVLKKDENQRSVPHRKVSAKSTSDFEIHEDAQFSDYDDLSGMWPIVQIHKL